MKLLAAVWFAFVGASTLIVPVSASDAGGATTYLAWKNDAPDLPSATSFLFDSNGCDVDLAPASAIPRTRRSHHQPSTTLVRRRLAFQSEQVASRSVLVLSFPGIGQGDFEDVRRKMELKVEREVDGVDEERLVEVLREREACGDEVKVVELDSMRELLDESESSWIHDSLLPLYPYTVLTSLTPSHTTLLNSPNSPSTLLLAEDSGTFTSMRYSAKRLRVLLENALSGPMMAVLVGIWAVGVLLIVRRVRANRRARREDDERRGEEEREGWGVDDGVVYDVEKVCMIPMENKEE
ncbi:Rad21/Rec8 N terminal domain protein [Pseudohyphozyma bogoriensis]|nr:Rad21/Rec8 N terminal domain protein [Pseudohyphozyma bogoriensis]